MAPKTKKQPVCYIAELDTPHYSFRATGTTRQEAVDMFIAGWRKHCKQTGADVDYVHEDDLRVSPLHIGVFTRDESVVYQAK